MKMRWFISVKSYGDCIIAINSLRNHMSMGDGLLCGSHLQTLVTAIGFKGNINWLETQGNTVPAIYDVRKFGVVAAITSGLNLYRFLHCSIPTNDLIVFDRLGWREHFLAGTNPKLQISSGLPNIYLDYENFLSVPRYSPALIENKIYKKIGIFPDSRLLQKRIDSAIVSDIFHDLVAIGFYAQIVYVGLVQPNSKVNSRLVNGFDMLVDSIRDFDIIISADSLPAHLAEFFNKPVFVISPKNNNYWLPKSALMNGGFALFTDHKKCIDWVRRFLVF